MQEKRVKGLGDGLWTAMWQGNEAWIIKIISIITGSHTHSFCIAFLPLCKKADLLLLVVSWKRDARPEMLGVHTM